MGNKSKDNLNLSQEIVRSLIEQSPVSIQIHSFDGKLINTNNAYSVLYAQNDETLSELHGKYNVLEDEQANKLGLMPSIEETFAGNPTTFPVYAREPDKIEHHHLRYTDPGIFFRIIEERFTQLNDTEITNSKEFWGKYIADSIDGKPIKEYIQEKVLPRPRDIIYFFKVAKDIAIARGHTQIQKQDVKQAHNEYSNWVFKSILVENGITIDQMNEFMYKLMACPKTINKSEIIKYARGVGIKIDEEEFIDHLVSLSIFGREIEYNKFYFEYEYDSAEKIKALANKFNSDRFQIHEAFVPYLECTAVEN